MKTVDLILSAGVRVQLDYVGNYFHLLSGVGMDIEFMQNGAVQSTAHNVQYGLFARPSGGFTSLGFLSQTNQTIKFAVATGDGGYNVTTGSVSIIGDQGPFTEPQFSVTNVNQQIRAANAAAQYLMVQNNDPAAVLRITLDGNPATATRGFRIQPGNSMELSVYSPTGAINAIMETATAAANNVEVAWS